MSLLSSSLCSCRDNILALLFVNASSFCVFILFSIPMCCFFCHSSLLSLCYVLGWHRSLTSSFILSSQRHLTSHCVVWLVDRVVRLPWPPHWLFRPVNLMFFCVQHDHMTTDGAHVRHVPRKMITFNVTKLCYNFAWLIIIGLVMMKPRHRLLVDLYTYYSCYYNNTFNDLSAFEVVMVLILYS